MQPRLTIHASPAASSTTTSSAVRPEGNESVTVRSHAGRSVGRALLIERLAFGAVDEALEHDRAIADSGERARRDREVVAHEVELRELTSAARSTACPECVTRTSRPSIESTSAASSLPTQLGYIGSPRPFIYLPVRGCFRLGGAPRMPRVSRVCRRPHAHARTSLSSSSKGAMSFFREGLFFSARQCTAAARNDASFSFSASFNACESCRIVLLAKQQCRGRTTRYGRVRENGIAWRRSRRPSRG